MYVLWPQCHSFSCSGSVTRSCQCIAFSKKKRREKMRGEKEIGWERQACRVTFCLDVQAIVRWGRQHQSLPLHWLAEEHTHTHTRWTKTASGRHMHSSICLNSYVNTHKKCRFADVFRKIVPLYFPSLFCFLTLLIKSAAQNKDSTFTLVLIHLMVFKSLPLSLVIVRLFVPPPRIYAHT